MTNITTQEAQKSAFICCGENAPSLKDINIGNVISVRNAFLMSVSFNGARSHRHIINVLEFMSQFIDKEEDTKPVLPDLHIIGYKYTTGGGWLYAERYGKLACISIDHPRGPFLEWVAGMPSYNDIKTCIEAHPHLKLN